MSLLESMFLDNKSRWDEDGIGWGQTIEHHVDDGAFAAPILCD